MEECSLDFLIRDRLFVLLEYLLNQVKAFFTIALSPIRVFNFSSVK